MKKHRIIGVTKRDQPHFFIFILQLFCPLCENGQIYLSIFEILGKLLEKKHKKKHLKNIIQH